MESIQSSQSVFYLGYIVMLYIFARGMKSLLFDYMLWYEFTIIQYLCLSHKISSAYYHKISSAYYHKISSAYYRVYVTNYPVLYIRLGIINPTRQIPDSTRAVRSGQQVSITTYTECPASIRKPEINRHN